MTSQPVPAFWDQWVREGRMELRWADDCMTDNLCVLRCARPETEVEEGTPILFTSEPSLRMSSLKTKIRRRKYALAHESVSSDSEPPQMWLIITLGLHQKGGWRIELKSGNLLARSCVGSASNAWWKWLRFCAAITHTTSGTVYRDATPSTTAVRVIPYSSHVADTGCECASDWAAVREKFIILRAVGLCYGLSDRFSVETNWQVSGLLRMLLACYYSQLGKPRVKISVLWLVS